MVIQNNEQGYNYEEPTSDQAIIHLPPDTDFIQYVNDSVFFFLAIDGCLRNQPLPTKLQGTREFTFERIYPKDITPLEILCLRSKSGDKCAERMVNIIDRLNKILEKRNSQDDSVRFRLASILDQLGKHRELLLGLPWIKDEKHKNWQLAVNIEGAIERTLNDPNFDLGKKDNYYNILWSRAVVFLREHPELWINNPLTEMDKQNKQNFNQQKILSQG